MPLTCTDGFVRKYLWTFTQNMTLSLDCAFDLREKVFSLPGFYYPPGVIVIYHCLYRGACAYLGQGARPPLRAHPQG